MQKPLLILFYFLITQISNAQIATQAYYDLIEKADSFYEAKNYKASAFAYTDAFRANEWKGLSPDRYNAACSWALAGIADSAFYYLNLIATQSNYTSFDELIADEDFNSLHPDKRWKRLVKIIKAKKKKADAHLNKQLVQQLDNIYSDDQQYRLKMEDYQKKYDNKSKEMTDLWKTIIMHDSINLIKVEAILEKYGWLGRDVVGQKGNSTLFLVIQHADLKTQEKYLPMMKEAVKNGKAQASSLALLIDRVEMRNERPQVYGPQITMKDGKYGIYEMIDEVNVNKRRAEVGLEPLEKYVRNWNIEYHLPIK